MDATLRLLRTLEFALLLSLIMYPLIGERMGPTEARDVGQLPMVLVVLAFANVITLALLRRRLVTSSEEVLRVTPDDPIALRRWQSGHIVSFAITEAIALYGIALRFSGATLRQVAPFYVAAILLMLIFSPRRPE